MGWYDTVERKAETSRGWRVLKWTIAVLGAMAFIAFCSYDWPALILGY